MGTKTIEAYEEDLRQSEIRYSKLLKENGLLERKLHRVETRLDAMEWALVLAQGLVRRMSERDWVKLAE